MRSKMNKEELIELIESDKSWTLAKHRSADQLIESFDSQETREYMWNKFLETNDYYYASLYKNVKH